MSELAYCYSQDTSALGDVTYKWSDPNTPADFFQSFASTGKGTIDPTIFTFTRAKDVYSIGNYMSFMHNGSSSSHYTAKFDVVKNNFIKNVDCLASAGTQQNSIFTQNNTTRFNQTKYSPDGIYSQDYDQRFYRDYDYNSLVIYPVFSGYYMTGETSFATFSDIPFWRVREYETQYPIRVTKMELKMMYGDINSGQLSSRVYSPRSYLPYIQFAGTVPTWQYNQAVSGRPFSYINPTGTTSGVYLFTIPWVVFNTPSHQTNSDNYIFISSSSNVQTIIPYDVNSLFESCFKYPNEFQYAITSTAILEAMCDRFGYNWAKSNEAATLAKTGIHCDNPDIRCPVIDNNGGVITQEVHAGSDIAQHAFENPESNYNWGTGAVDFNGSNMIEVRIEYSTPEQPTVEPTEEIDLNEPVIATSGGNSIWLVGEDKVKEFFTWMWNPDGTIFDDIVKGCALLGENPMDSVVSLKLFPFDLSQLPKEYRMICFGRVKSPVNAAVLTGSNVINIDLGSFLFNDSGLFNDFRDYEPYSDYSLYIPFIGVVPLQAVECINTTISVKLIVDLIVGSCTAVIFTNGVPYKYVDGQIGMEIPVTGRNLAAYGQTILAGALAGIHVAGKAVGAIGSSSAAQSVPGFVKETVGRGASNVASAFGAGENPAINLSDAGMNLATGTMNVATGALTAVGGIGAAGLIATAPIIVGAAIPALLNNPQPQSAGCNSPATGLSKPLYPYFIVRRSDCWIPENYNKLYGRPVQQGGKISDFHGFCKFGNLCLDGLDATEAEKTMINDSLQNGVII